MSIPAEVTHVVFGGSLPSGEQWESGFWVQGATPTDNDTANAMAELVYGMLTSTDATGTWTALAAYIATGTTLTYVRVYAYPAGGTVAAFIGEHTATAVAGASTTTPPNQICFVISLRTEHAGRRFRGRMYLPYAGVNLVAGTAQTTTGNTDVWAAHWAGFFTDWNTSGDNGVIVVVSRVGAGAATPVSAVSVDTIPDTQRRRRNKVSPTGISVANVTGSA